MFRAHEGKCTWIYRRSGVQVFQRSTLLHSHSSIPRHHEATQSDTICETKEERINRFSLSILGKIVIRLRRVAPSCSETLLLECVFTGHRPLGQGVWQTGRADSRLNTHGSPNLLVLYSVQHLRPTKCSETATTRV
jgi:hypothetical protein